MESNVSVLTSLSQFYERLGRNKDFPLNQSCEENIISFSVQINDLIYDSQNQIARANVLGRITADRKAMVTSQSVAISGIQHLLCDFLLLIGFATSSESGNNENGRSESQHAQNWRFIPKRGNRHANCNCCDIDLFTSDLCISMHSELLLYHVANRCPKDVFQYRHY